MRRILIALAIVAVTALPSFAAGTGQCRGMQDPRHLLMMAYHKNVMIFGNALARAARQGDTVPRDFAQTAIAEMRRSIDEMEKYRAQSPAGTPETKAPPEMQNMMDEHIVRAKNELRQLDELAKSDRIPSQEVLKHLQFLEGCREMAGKMHGGGMYCGEGHRPHGCREGMMSALPDRHRMMEEQVRKMKAQDAELAKEVARMKRAPKEKKVDLMSKIVAKLVEQRAEMTNSMEKAQKQMKQQFAPKADGSYPQYAPPPPPNTPMFRDGEGPDDEEGADVDMGDMEMGDDVTE